MNFLQNQQPVDLIRHQILLENRYRTADPNGHETEWNSQDIPSAQALFNCADWSALLDDIMRKRNLPFQFDRTLKGVTYTVSQPLAQRIVSLISGLPVLCSPHHEPAEDIKLIVAIVQQLGLTSTLFSGYPSAYIGLSEVREGELLNTFVHRLRDAAAKASFSNAVKQRKSESTQMGSRWERLYTRLLENHGSICALKVELRHQADPGRAMTLQDASQQLSALLNAVATDECLRQSVGYAWKRLYSSEVGYRTKLWLLFNSFQVGDIRWPYDRILEHWESITLGKGDEYFEGQVPMWADQLRSDIKLSIQAMSIWRLSNHGRIPQMGLSDMPPKLSMGAKPSSNAVLTSFQPQNSGPFGT